MAFTSPVVYALYDIPDPETGVEFYSVVLSCITSQYDSHDLVWYVSEKHGVWNGNHSDYVQTTHEGQTLLTADEARLELKKQLKKRIKSGFPCWITSSGTRRLDDTFIDSMP